MPVNVNNISLCMKYCSYYSSWAKVHIYCLPVLSPPLFFFLQEVIILLFGIFGTAVMQGFPFTWKDWISSPPHGSSREDCTLPLSSSNAICLNKVLWLNKIILVLEECIALHVIISVREEVLNNWDGDLLLTQGSAWGRTLDPGIPHPAQLLALLGGGFWELWTTKSRFPTSA